jgi:amidase
VDEYAEEVLGYLRRVEPLSAADRAKAREALDRLAGEFRAALATVDVLALPVSRVPPPLRDADPTRASFELTALVGPASAAGLAAASVPCGTAHGLPVGLQLVAADERTVLAAVRRVAAAASPADSVEAPR